MKTSWWRLLTALVLVAMIAGPMGAGSSVQAAPSVSSKTSVQADQPDPTAKLDGELQTLAQQGGTESVAVLIVVEKGTDLSRVADVKETRPYMEGQLIFANVQQNKLTKLATTKGVVVVGAYHQIQKPITSPDESRTQLTTEQTKQLRADYQAKLAADKAAREKMAAASAGSVSTQSAGTQDWLGAQFIKAPEAWAKGYQGQGVNVAVVDSGVDFGHPDLNGLQATYPSGPFEGWPIAFDPRSMRELVYYGATSSNNFSDDADYSWYAGTYVFNPDTDPATGETVDTMLPWGYDAWMIAKDLVDLSKSGKLYWGIHPDTQLYDYVYDWVPFILIDSTTAGVYDTVIADLNFDHWFDSYDAMANKADPVLSVDLGSFLLEDTLVPAGTQYVPNTEFGAPPTWYGTPDMVTDPAGVTLGAGTFIYAYNHYTDLATYPDAMDGADGTADVSGGMVYYIADGVNRIPGMDYLYPDYPIPQNASLVAFMLGSDYAGGGDHGTLCASAVAGQGNIKGYYGIYGEIAQYETADFANFPFGTGGDASTALDFLRPADQGTVQGPAPQAKIIALGDNYEAVNGMQGFLDSYTFLAYGVDGVPNSGDEFVDIMSMSYGDGSVHEDGWDIESRLLAYYNLNYLPNTAMMTSAGNGGSGFGTVSAPNPYTGITVAASTSYGISDVFGGALTLDQINQGEITPFSNRGPNAMGQPDPQVSAGGAWAAGDAPLNLAGIYNTFMGLGLFSGDGNMAWEEWGGTSRSAPESAGVMALIYQAYKDANGEFPTWEKARELIMSSAEDLSHDVLVQGAGRVDADRGTDVAAGLAGFSVSPAQFSAGESMGEGFASVMMPGDTSTQTLTVDNPTADDATLTVGDEVLARMDETQEYTVDVNPDGREDPYPGTYYYYPTYFVIPDAGAALTQHGADLAIPIPAGAEMMQVQMVAPFGLFDQYYQDPDPLSVSYNQAADHRFSMAVYAWTDRNADGILWDDVDGDKAVNPINGTDVVDHAYVGPTLETEINRFGYSYNHSNLQEVTVRLTGEDRTGANQPKIVIGITHNKPNVGRSGTIQVRVVFYQKADWDLVSTSATSLDVPAGGSATFDATVTVPADMATGLYEGAITVADDDHTALVPVTVNVATPSDQMLFNMGGTEEGMLAYDNGRTYAGNQWSGAIEEGDWRFFFYDAMANMAQKYLYVQNDFGTAANENMPTMDETVGFTPNTGDQFSKMDPTNFGPYSMTYSGGTWDSHGPQSDWGNPRQGVWYWEDQYGDPLPQTRSWLDLNDGLNLVEFRNILSSGQHVDGDPFKATVGVLGVDAPETLVINTDQLSGSYPIDVISPIDGMVAYASGVSKPYQINGITVPQGTDTSNFPPADLLNGYIYTFDVANTDEIEVHLSSAYYAGSDADLYLLYDANKDGIFNPYDPKEVLDYSDYSGSFEDIYYSGSSAGIPFVADGKYAVVVYGYYMVPGDTVDLSIFTYGGNDINVNNAGKSNNWMIDTMAGVRTTTDLNWEVPSAGIWYGYMVFGMPNDDHTGIEGRMIYVDVVINAGGVDLSGSTFTVDKAEIGMRHIGSAPALLNYTLEVVNSGTEMIPVEISNLLPPELSGSMVSWENEAGQSSDSSTIWNSLNGVVMVGPASGKYTFHYRAAVQAGFVGMITNRVRLNTGFGGIVRSPVTLDAAADANQTGMMYSGSDLPPMELTATTNVLYTTMLSTVLR